MEGKFFFKNWGKFCFLFFLVFISHFFSLLFFNFELGFETTLNCDDKIMYGELCEFVQLETVISSLIENRSDDDSDSVFSATNDKRRLSIASGIRRKLTRFREFLDTFYKRDFYIFYDLWEIESFCKIALVGQKSIFVW